MSNKKKKSSCSTPQIEVGTGDEDIFMAKQAPSTWQTSSHASLNWNQDDLLVRLVFGFVIYDLEDQSFSQISGRESIVRPLTGPLADLE